MKVSFQLQQKPITMKLLLFSTLLAWNHLRGLCNPRYKELGTALDLWLIKLAKRKTRISKLFRELRMLMLMLLLSWEITKARSQRILQRNLIEFHILEKTELLELFQAMITTQLSENKDLCLNLTYKAKTIINKFPKLDKLHSSKAFNNRTSNCERLWANKSEWMENC